MRIVVGLGNPGDRFIGTRHNAGLMLVDLLSERARSSYGWRKHYNSLVFKGEDMVLVKTKDVFMNESGRLFQGLPEGDIYVAHDDLDLRLGEYKIQKGVGPKVHYGIQSAENALGTKDFWRIRIGVDDRESAHRTPGDEYVLQKFSASEKEIINHVLSQIADEIYQPNS